MRIGLIEFLLILAIASLTVGPRVALFVDRWMRRANRANAMAARRRAEYAAQMAAERDAMLKRFRTASTVFGVGILLVLVYALGFRPIDTPPQIYKAPTSGRRRARCRRPFPPTARPSWSWGVSGRGLHPRQGRPVICRCVERCCIEKAHQRSCAHRWRARCRHPERGGRADRLCL